MEENLAQNNQNGGLSEPVLDNNQNMNVNEQTNTTPTEFAEKKPLVNDKSRNKFIKGGIGCAIFIILIVIGASVYKMITSGPVIPPPPKTCEDGSPPPCEEPPPPPVVEDKPKIAYIKNDKEIWLVDTDGENKEKLKEIPQSVNQLYSDLDWKNITELTYSQCEPSGRNCRIETIDIKNRSIETNHTSNAFIKSLVWSNDQKYLGYIEKAGGEIEFKLKSGTVDNSFSTMSFGNDKNNINTDVIFTDNNNYVIYSTIKKDLPASVRVEPIEYPIVEIYQVNGVKVDEIKDAEFPMYKTENIVVYKINNELVFRTIGKNDQSYVTRLKGNNPTLSPDETDIAYWVFDPTQNNVDIGIYDSDLDLHKNILRGMVKPQWIDQDTLMGVEISNCLSGSCDLYQFQTNNLVLVNVAIDSFERLDQAKTITGIDYFDKPYEIATSVKEDLVY